MLSAEQLQSIQLLSDTVLYADAVCFMRKLVREQHCDPLPASQVAGLLNIAGAAKYDELRRFIIHQRDRNWPPSKRDIKTFYTALEEMFSLMQRKRLRDEFHLMTASRDAANEIRQEVDELMAEPGARIYSTPGRGKWCARGRKGGRAYETENEQEIDMVTTRKQIRCSSESLYAAQPLCVHRPTGHADRVAYWRG